MKYSNGKTIENKKLRENRRKIKQKNFPRAKKKCLDNNKMENGKLFYRKCCRESFPLDILMMRKSFVEAKKGNNFYFFSS
jgi:hypothetical protein